MTRGSRPDYSIPKSRRCCSGPCFSCFYSPLWLQTQSLERHERAAALCCCQRESSSLNPSWPRTRRLTGAAVTLGPAPLTRSSSVPLDFQQRRRVLFPLSIIGASGSWSVRLILPLTLLNSRSIVALLPVVLGTRLSASVRWWVSQGALIPSVRFPPLQPRQGSPKRRSRRGSGRRRRPDVSFEQNGGVGGWGSLRDVRGSLSSSDWSSATVITFASDRPGAKSGVAAQSRARRLFPSRAATRALATHQGSAAHFDVFSLKHL